MKPLDIINEESRAPQPAQPSEEQQMMIISGSRNENHSEILCCCFPSHSSGHTDRQTEKKYECSSDQAINAERGEIMFIGREDRTKTSRETFSAPRFSE
jgi:hypothetical protein